jgi:hypothetical protein
MKQTKLLTLILVLQLFTFFGRWVDWSYVTPTYAQVPDSGAQRMQMIEQQKATNDKLDKIISMLESGKLQVSVKKVDDDKEAGK